MKLTPQKIIRSFVDRESIVTFFDGCVYIQDLNSILLPNGDIVNREKFNIKFGGRTFALDNENVKTTTKAWDAFLFNSIVTFPRVDGVTSAQGQPFQAVYHIGGRVIINTHKDD